MEWASLVAWVGIRGHWSRAGMEGWKHASNSEVWTGGHRRVHPGESVSQQGEHSQQGGWVHGHSVHDYQGGRLPGWGLGMDV